MLTLKKSSKNINLHYEKLYQSRFNTEFPSHLLQVQSRIMIVTEQKIYRQILFKHSAIILVPTRMNGKIKRVLSIRIGFKKKVRRGNTLYMDVNSSLAKICIHFLQQ